MQSGSNRRLLKLLGTFAGCFVDGRLLTAALYKNDESSQPGCPQEPVEGPCNQWAPENSSKERLNAKRGQEQSEGSLDKQKSNFNSPPRYHTSAKTSIRSSTQDSKAQSPPHIPITGIKKHRSFQADLPAMPGLNQVEPNQQTNFHTQGQAFYACFSTNTNAQSLPELTMAVNLPNYAPKNTPRHQQLNLPSETLHSFPQTLHQLPFSQQSQAQTPVSSQPWSASLSGQTGTFTGGSNSTSGSTYQTSPSSAGSTTPYTYGVQLAPVDQHLPFLVAQQMITQGADYMREKIGSCSSRGTPRNERQPSEGPIIIRSEG